MVSHFSANQYEDAFSSTKLRNWTVPRKYKRRPSTLEGYTQIIASDRGHLLQGAPRSNVNPWGTFMGTWDMPCKIPPARPCYTARTNHAAKNLYVFKSDSSLNNAVNGYKEFGKGKKMQTSPFQRPGAPTPPRSRSNEKVIEQTVRVKSPEFIRESPKFKTKSPVPENVQSPIARSPCMVSPPVSKPPTPARSINPQRYRSATPQSGRFISPRAQSNLSHRSIPARALMKHAPVRATAWFECGELIREYARVERKRSQVITDRFTVLAQFEDPADLQKQYSPFSHLVIGTPQTSCIIIVPT